MNKKEWRSWIFAAIGNGVIAALWLVFGLAAAGGSNAGSSAIFRFATLTIISASVPLIGSAYLMAKAKFKSGFAVTFLTLPCMVAVMTLM